MADWPTHADGQRTELLGTRIVQGNILAFGSPANTKGVYNQLTTLNGVGAAQGLDTVTAFDAVGIWLLTSLSSVSSQLVDVAVGAAGSETIIISNFHFQHAKASSMGQSVYFPISIPAGTNIRGRTQSNTASGSTQLSIRMQGAGYGQSAPRALCETLGTNLAATRGTNLSTPGGTNTLSAWTTIGTTTRTYEELLINFQSLVAAWSATPADIALDIGIGPAASEVVILSALHFNAQQNPDAFATPFIGPLPVHIPPGTRVAARYQTNALVNNYDLTLYGMS